MVFLRNCVQPAEKYDRHICSTCILEQETGPARDGRMRLRENILYKYINPLYFTTCDLWVFVLCPSPKIICGCIVCGAHVCDVFIEYNIPGEYFQACNRNRMRRNASEIWFCFTLKVLTRYTQNLSYCIKIIKWQCPWPCPVVYTIHKQSKLLYACSSWID